MKAVIFAVAEKNYGSGVEQVREVIRMRRITPVPDVASYVEGVISLRGKVLPVINLRKKLGHPAQENAANRIIITKIGDHWTGIIVDQVRDVVSFGDADITPPDEMFRSARYVTGIARWKDSLVLLVDLSGLLMGDEASGLRKVQERVEVRKK